VRLTTEFLSPRLATSSSLTEKLRLAELHCGMAPNQECDATRVEGMEVSSNVPSWEPFMKLSDIVRKFGSGTVNHLAYVGIVGGRTAF